MLATGIRLCRGQDPRETLETTYMNLPSGKVGTRFRCYAFLLELAAGVLWEAELENHSFLKEPGLCKLTFLKEAAR
jgi:hypothetical protein